jgi:hypothetical protein
MRSDTRIGGVIVIGLLLVAGTVAAQWWNPDTPVMETMPAGHIDWTAGLVFSSAQASVVAQEGPTSSRWARAFAAAVHAAQQRVLETLKQLPLDANRTVDSVLRDSAETQQALEMLVTEADVVRTQYLPRDFVEVTLQASLFGRLTSLVWPAPLTNSAPVHEASDGVYTGIVIDARGLAIRQALFPRILGEDGQTIYAPPHVDAAIAAQRGYIVYTKTLNSSLAASRVGTNPLVIRAHRVAGPSRVDLLIRRTDVAVLQRSAATRLLLNHCLVVIVG